MVTDADAKYIHTITLSYTFYEIDMPEAETARANDTLIKQASNEG